MYLACSKSTSTLFSHIIYFKIYLCTPKKLFPPLYTIHRPFTIMSFKNNKVKYRIYCFKIFIIVLINSAIKFIPFINTIIYYKNLKGAIKAIRFLLFILSFN